MTDHRGNTESEPTFAFPPMTQTPRPDELSPAVEGEVPEPAVDEEPPIGEEPAAGATTAKPWFKTLPWWAWAAAGVAIIAIVVIVVVLIGRNSSPSTGLRVPVIIATAPAPTPTAEPIQRGEGSKFFAAIPGTSVQFALASLAKDDTWGVDADVIEAYRATYAGADKAGSPAEFTVNLGQWATADGASAFAASLVAELPVGQKVDTGETLVGTTPAGTFTISYLADADGNPSGVGRAIWTNGTAVVDVTGPASEITAFYEGFGL